MSIIHNSELLHALHAAKQLFANGCCVCQSTHWQGLRWTLAVWMGVCMAAPTVTRSHSCTGFHGCIWHEDSTTIGVTILYAHSTICNWPWRVLHVGAYLWLVRNQGCSSESAIVYTRIYANKMAMDRWRVKVLRQEKFLLLFRHCHRLACSKHPVHISCYVTVSRASNYCLPQLAVASVEDAVSVRIASYTGSSETEIQIRTAVYNG